MPTISCHLPSVRFLTRPRLWSMYALLRQQHGFSTHGDISASCCPIAGRNCDRPCVYAILRQHSDFGLAWPGRKLTQPSGSPLYFKPNWLGAGSHLAALSSRFGAVRSNEPNSWRGLNPCNSVLVQQFCPVVCLVTDSVNGIWSSLPQRHVAGVGG
jgi:hypothetical protein